MQCTECWEPVKSDSYRCTVCGEFFCSLECQRKHEKGANDFNIEKYDFVDKYQDYNKYPWER